MTRWLTILAIVTAIAGSATATAQQVDLAQRQDEVRLREQAFAKTMADRNLAAFTAFLSDEAIFFGGAGATRGPQEITAGWKRFFDGPQAPFSWRPETIEVLRSGNLALSSGPVLDPAGKQIGTFNSTWRRDADGVWRIIFDKGC